MSFFYFRIARLSRLRVRLHHQGFIELNSRIKYMLPFLILIVVVPAVLERVCGAYVTAPPHNSQAKSTEKLYITCFLFYVLQ